MRRVGLWLFSFFLAVASGCGGGTAKPDAGASGGAGTTGSAGTSGGAGTTGGAGVAGGAGTSGSAGTVGGAGTTGGSGPTGGSGTIGVGGRGGAAAGNAGTIGAGGRAGVAGGIGGSAGGNGGRGGSAGTAGLAGTGGGAACAACTSYGTPEPAGQVTVAALNTLSGIGVSKRNPSVLYVHKDMAQPAFYAVSETATLLGTYTLQGATVVDLEDMAVAHCPSGSCVYLADIGGNLGSRAEFAVLRAPEPAVSSTQAATTATVSFERMAFTYPDGQHNAESLLVDPGSDTLYVITKLAAGQASAVYRIAPAWGSTTAAQKIADLPVPRAADQPATSASAHPCGAGFLLRTNNTLYEFRIAVGAAFEDAFKVAPVTVPVATEPQGEAVAYRQDGRGYVTTGEGSMPVINRVSCR